MAVICFEQVQKKNHFGVRVLYFKDPFLWLVDFVIFKIFFFLSELDSERRALEESEQEKRLLASKVEDLSARLELAERERREVMFYADVHAHDA